MRDKQQSDKGKIAIYLPSLRGGGAERVMVILANGFVERGYMVDLVLANAVGPYLNEVSSKVHIVDLKSKRVALSLPGLYRYLRKAKPQALYSAMRHANVIAALACKLANVETRLIISERNALSASDWQDGGLHASLLKALMRRAYLFADKIVAVSFGVADDLAFQLNLPRNSIDVIHNPVPMDRIISSIDRPILFPWFPEHGVRIIAAGRLTRQKGFIDLIRAFAHLRKTRDATLIILGEGELRSELDNEALKLGVSQDVILPGFIEAPFALIAKSELFVLSSLWEGLPNVLIQAMACGTPVVSTDCPFGPAEILENGKWGKLVPLGDVQALADAMHTALDEKVQPDVVMRAREFDVDRAVDRYLDLMANQRIS